MKKIKKRLLSFTITQLVLTLISLPILVGWGLGISCMSIIGNLVFTPLLTIFLLLCTLLFFCELLYIPNGAIVWLLEKFTAIWHYLLHLGSPTWLISYPKPPLVFLLFIILATGFVLMSTIFKTAIRRALGLVGLTGLCVIFFSFFQAYKNRQACMLRFDKNIYCMKVANEPSLIFVDTGTLERKKSLEKMISFELKPWIVKNFGAVSFKEVRFRHLNAKTLHAAKTLANHWYIKTAFFSLR